MLPGQRVIPLDDKWVTSRPNSKQTPQRIHHYIYHIILTPLHHLNVHLFHYNVESENTAEITAPLVASQPPTHTLKTEYFQIITGVDRPRNIPLHICAYIHHTYIYSIRMYINLDIYQAWPLLLNTFAGTSEVIRTIFPTPENVSTRWCL